MRVASTCSAIVFYFKKCIFLKSRRFSAGTKFCFQKFSKRAVLFEAEFNSAIFNFHFVHFLAFQNVSNFFFAKFEPFYFVLKSAHRARFFEALAREFFPKKNKVEFIAPIFLQNARFIPAIHFRKSTDFFLKMQMNELCRKHRGSAFIPIGMKVSARIKKCACQIQPAKETSSGSYASFQFLYRTYSPSNACFKSAIKSSLLSRPHEKRTKPAGIPAAASCSSVICLCVLVAGLRQQLLASAT